MYKMDNFVYDCLTYTKYKERLADIYRDEKLQKMGLTKINLPKTSYGYDLDAFSIGYGSKEIFLVAGTHSSEIVSVDMLTQLIKNLPNMKEFNPNVYKIICMPLQNPEGFDIVTSNLIYNDMEAFNNSSYEYYLKYKIDNILNNILIEINNCRIDNMDKPINYLLNELKKITLSSINVKTLEKQLPNFTTFIKLFNNIKEVKTYKELGFKIYLICQKLKNKYLNDDAIYCFILDQICNNLNNDLIKFNKLHLDMFKDINEDIETNRDLENELRNYENKYKHPSGSRIIYDANGRGINLNFNTPRLYQDQLKNNNEYGWGIKNDIKKFVPGPLGTSTCGNSFSYEIENKVLYSLINNSISRGNYYMSLLYHATGGIIYYKPHDTITEPNNYEKYSQLNESVAYNYNIDTNYKISSTSSDLCYGDLLRSKYPRVILLDISKMGGNPIGPYGDANNIYNTINDNIKGFQRVLKYDKQR